jgi:hypothetical protein
MDLELQIENICRKRSPVKLWLVLKEKKINEDFFGEEKLWFWVREAEC